MLKQIPSLLRLKSYSSVYKLVSNYITNENVIRNSLIVDEGDPLNKILQNKSANNLKSKNIFRSVKYEIVDIWC